MSLLYFVLAPAVILFGIILILLSRQHKKSKKLTTELSSIRKNHEYLVYLIRDLEDIFGYGSDLGNVVDLISKSLESTLPHSTISSLYIKREKLVFKSQIKEAINHAFLNKVKDTMIQALGLPQEQKLPVDENITGVSSFDDVSTSEIKSSADITLTVSFQTQAVINISSTSENLYTEEDKKILSTVSYLVSGFLTRLDVLLKLEKSKSLAMIDSFSDGIFMLDTQNTLIAMNNSAQNFLNVHKKRPTMNDVLTALPNTYNFKEKIEKCIRENRALSEEDVNINGKVFKIVITPVHELSNAADTQSARRQEGTIGASVLLHDITLENSLTQMKEDFTNVMVHELRSPLTAIKASSEFLMSQADLTDAEKKRLTEMISESSNKMLDKIALILDAAKMDANLFTIRKIESDLKKLLSDRINEFTPLAQEKSIVLKTNIDPTIPMFSFDPTRIDEVVNNLLSNSLKFTKEHGTISLQATVDSDKVTVSVSDTGEGIPLDKQGKLFAKFQQAPSDGEGVGTGLGLYVVKEVVEKHGGKVSLTSEEGKGTTISFTLPLHPLAAALPQVTSQQAENPQRMVN